MVVSFFSYTIRNGISSRRRTKWASKGGFLRNEGSKGMPEVEREECRTAQLQQKKIQNNREKEIK